MVSFFTPQQQLLGFKDPIVVLTLSQCITHLISAPSDTRILILMVSFLKTVCWQGSKVTAIKYEHRNESPAARSFSWLHYKQNIGPSCSEAASSPAWLGEAFQVSYQKIFTSVKYCSSILSVDIGKIGPHRRTFQAMEDHSRQNMIKSRTGCSI